jgi:NTE family protein
MRFSFVIIFIALFQSFTLAQQNSERPSLGLVLSGGGAHGIAHLGVIMVMEEAGLRPDYISGTSMGSIIGGMYAAGYSADSLYKMLKSTNWNEVLSNKIPENWIVYPEKQRFYNSIISLSISTKKVNIPLGLNNGQQIEKVLSYYLWPVADISDFSKLPIPFVCNAVDIFTYRNIDLKQGYLADAIRASFTVPSIFTPIQIDTLLLLDGGLLRNFAASAVKDLGADIIIGSQVGVEKQDEERFQKLQTLPGIITQIAMFSSRLDFDEEKKLVEILVRPDIDRFSITDFNNVDSLVLAGYVAALPQKEKFKRLADSLNMFGQQPPLPYVLDKEYLTFDKIEINGNKNYETFQILGILDVKPDRAVSRQHLTEKIDLLYGRSWFEKVSFRIESRNDSLILAVDCIEKPNAMLYGSVHYDNALQAGLILGFTLKNHPIHRSVIDFNSYIGTFYRIETDFIQYLGKNQKVGFNLNLFADNTLFPWFEHNRETGNTFGRSTIYKAGFNNYLGLNNMISISGSYNETSLKPNFIKRSEINNYKYNYWSSELAFSRNVLTNKYFPEKGLLLQISAGISKLQTAYRNIENTKINITKQSNFNYDYHPVPFYVLRGSIINYSTINKVNFGFGGEILYTSKTDSISEQNNFLLLGGIQATSKRSVTMTGFHPNQIKIRNLAIFRSEMNISLLKDLRLNVMADFAATNNILFPRKVTFLSGYGLGLSYSSIIGPIKTGVMYGLYENDDGHFSPLKTYIIKRYLLMLRKMPKILK